MFEAGLALATKREYEHGVQVRHIAVERHVTMAAAPDDQLALSVAERSSDQRAVRKDVNRLKYIPDACRRFVGGGACQVVEEAVEVVKDLGRVLDPRHVGYD